jgi:hypothetical protein
LYIQRFGNGFKWDDVKEHFIPFLKMLIREYDVDDHIRFGMVSYPLNRWLPHETYRINEVLNDDDLSYLKKVSRRIINVSINLKEKV